MLIEAIDELPAAHVIGDLLSLSQLPGQGPLPCRHHLEGERVQTLHLVRVMLGQMLRHRVLLVIGPDLLLMGVNSRVRRKSRLSSVPHLANITDPGVIAAGSEVTGARAGHVAVREQAPREVNF